MEIVMKRLSIGALLVLLAVAYLHAVPLYPAKAQSLAPTGLNKNGLSAIGHRIIRTPAPTRAANSAFHPFLGKIIDGLRANLAAA